MIEKNTFDSKDFLKHLTGKPGIYKMFDVRGDILYIGKARNLKKRVSSYFRPPEQLEPKTRTMMSHMVDIEVTVTHTEGEALLLEANLIKQHTPRYNILLRDDKSYPYIFLSSEQKFPAIVFHRGARKRKGRYFGPYPSAGAVRTSLNLLQKLFQIRQCEESFFNNRSRPCLQYQIKRCTAPCVGNISKEDYAKDLKHAIWFLEGRSAQVIEELIHKMELSAGKLDFEMAAHYRDQIGRLNRVQENQYISGNGGDIDIIAVDYKSQHACIQVLYIRDGRQIDNRQYFPTHTRDADKASIIRAFVLQYYLNNTRRNNIPSELIVSDVFEDEKAVANLLSREAKRKVSIRSQVRGERLHWLSMGVQNAKLALTQRMASNQQQYKLVEDLQQALSLDELPNRMECFDISHTSGELTVASCVVFDRQGALKSDYRKFNINNITPGDDYAAMRQVLLRRYTRVKTSDTENLPDILLIDGGKGQIGEAKAVMDELQIDSVLIVGVAKGEGRKPGLESLFLPGIPEPIILPADSLALHLIQQIRDEAHRFAITSHRARRAKRRNTSGLEDISGVGPGRRQRLLKHFGGIQGVSSAGVEDLAKIEGISLKLAQSVYDHFHDE